MFKDRSEAGSRLAAALSFLNGRTDIVVLAIPRGGVAVADEVASVLGAPLDVIITRKIGAPGNPELAIGAVTQEGELILDSELVRTLGVSEDYIKREASKQVDEIRERNRKYRGGRSPPNLSGKTVVIVDDGIATGATTRAAVESIKRAGATSIVLAVPVGAPETVQALSSSVDQVVCLETPPYLGAIGEFYENFEQVQDDVVKKILNRTRPS